MKTKILLRPWPTMGYLSFYDTTKDIKHLQFEKKQNVTFFHISLCIWMTRTDKTWFLWKSNVHYILACNRHVL